MSQPLYWSSQRAFYPIGNTPPVCLTEALSPGQPANILLLGCGDPRNILFTIYADQSTPLCRNLTFTCCDIEPAVLARNVLLFTLIEDSESIDRVWDIFYHFQIDDSALSLITRQCQKLLSFSSSIESWVKSPYGSFLKFIDARTLIELHQHWILYARFQNSPRSLIKRLEQEKEIAQNPVVETNNVFNIAGLVASRSAGPLLGEALLPVSLEFFNYWKTGTMFQRQSDIKKARNLNPTFIYSLSGETFNVHYGTFPQGFHFAPLFAPVVPGELGSSMKQQFRAWVKAFQASHAVNSITIHLYVGDALALCRALRNFSVSGQTKFHLPSSPWKASQINLDQLSSNVTPSPTVFDVIDTSNLADHLGLLNVLLATQPLLKSSSLSHSVLYTETMQMWGKDLTKSLESRLGADIPTAGLLFGLVPQPYMTNFTTYSNVHQLFTQPESHKNYHERVAWVDPISGDRKFGDQRQAIIFNPKDLAKILYNIFRNIFNIEKSHPILPILCLHAKPDREKILFHYHRETMAMLFEIVRRRVRVLDNNWILVASMFMDWSGRHSSLHGLKNIPELFLQLHHRGILFDQSVDIAQKNHVPKTKAIRQSSEVIAPSPRAACIVLTVPRSSLRILLDNQIPVANVILQCNIVTDEKYMSSYTSLQCVWGRCVPADKSCRITIEEDKAGINGDSGLVVTFWVASSIINQGYSTISFGFKENLLARATLGRALGPKLELFNTTLQSSRHTRILPYRPALASETHETWNAHPKTTEPSAPATCDLAFRPVISSTWMAGSRITALAATIKIPSNLSKALRRGKLSISATQISPCGMQVSLRSEQHIIVFPYPINIDSVKFNFLRDSRELEIKVHIAKPLGPGGYAAERFPMLLHGRSYTPWSFPHINLEKMPLVALNDCNKLGWLPMHTQLQLSSRERLQQSGTLGMLSLTRFWLMIKRLLSIGLFQSQRVYDGPESRALTSLKYSIHEITRKYSGIDQVSTKIFSLDLPFLGTSAYILIGGVRLDLAASSIVLDAAIFWPSRKKSSIMKQALAELTKRSELIEPINNSWEGALAWKEMVPSLAERCRTWEHKPDCKYALRKGASIATSIGDSPLCGCGHGVGFSSPQWDIPEWKSVLPHATRMAISPMFSVPYVERIIDKSSKGPFTSIANFRPHRAMQTHSRSFGTNAFAVYPTLIHSLRSSSYAGFPPHGRRVTGILKYTRLARVRVLL